MKRLLPIVAALTMMAPICTSCMGGDDTANVDRADATALYKQQKAILLAYIDTLQHSKDSTVLAQLPARLDHALTRASQQHEAEADFRLTNAQQDTLAMLTHKFLALKNKKVPALNLSKDSVAEDTVR